MNVDEIKLDIKNRISKIDKSFNPYISIWNYKEKIYGIDINSLETLLKKAARFLIICSILTIISTVFLIVVSFGSFYAKNEVMDVEKLRFLLFSEYLFVSGTIKYQKLKRSLENKIYLLELLSKIEKV